MQRRGTIDADPVGTLLDARAHPPQPLGHGGETVALFHTKLGRAADHGYAGCLAGQADDHRDLVDGGGNFRRAEGNGGKRPTGDGYRARWFDLRGAEFNIHAGAHALEDPEKGSPGGIQADTLDGYRPAGPDGGSGEPECRRRQIPRHLELEWLQRAVRWAQLNGRAPSPTLPRKRGRKDLFEIRAHGDHQTFQVVARGDRFNHGGRPARRQAGQKNRALDLRAWGVQDMATTLERHTFNEKRRAPIVRFN